MPSPPSPTGRVSRDTVGHAMPHLNPPRGAACDTTRNDASLGRRRPQKSIAFEGQPSMPPPRPGHLLPLSHSQIRSTTCGRPEGAKTDQPRAERSAALGTGGNATQALKGRHKQGRRLFRPFRACSTRSTCSQGDGDARTTRVALPWAGLFGPFGANAPLFPRRRCTHGPSILHQKRLPPLPPCGKITVGRWAMVARPRACRRRTVRTNHRLHGSGGQGPAV